jgi:hypothetical protein
VTPDPPGDPGGVRAAAATIGRLAALTRTAGEAMRVAAATAGGPGLWVAADATEFAVSALLGTGDLLDDANRLAAARAVLDGYADTLEQVQGQVTTLTREIEDLKDDESDDPLNPVDHGDEIDAVRRRIQALRASAAEAALAAAATLDGLDPGARLPGQVGPGAGFAGQLAAVAEAIRPVTDFVDGFSQSAGGLLAALPGPPGWIGERMRRFSSPEGRQEPADWSLLAVRDPGTAAALLQDALTAKFREAIAAEDWERGDYVAALGRTLLPDTAYEIGRAEIEWFLRTIDDPGAGFAEAGQFLGGIVHADLWKEGRYLEAAGRTFISDEFVDDVQAGSYARAAGRVAFDIVLNLLTAGLGRGATTARAVETKVATEVAESVAETAARKPATLLDQAVAAGDDLVPDVLDVPAGAVPDGPAPLAIDDPALRITGQNRAAREQLEALRGHEMGVADDGRFMELHGPGDGILGPIRNFWRQRGPESWLAGGNARALFMHGDNDLLSFHLKLPDGTGIVLSPEAVAAWAKGVWARNGLTAAPDEVLRLFSCSAARLDTGVVGRIGSRVDDLVRLATAGLDATAVAQVRREVAEGIARTLSDWSQANGTKARFTWKIRDLLAPKALQHEFFALKWRVVSGDGLPGDEGRLGFLKRLMDDAWGETSFTDDLSDEVAALNARTFGDELAEGVEQLVRDRITERYGPGVLSRQIDGITAALRRTTAGRLSEALNDDTVAALGDLVRRTLAERFGPSLAPEALDALARDTAAAIAGTVQEAFADTVAGRVGRLLGLPTVGARDSVFFPSGDVGVYQFLDSRRHGWRLVSPGGGGHDIRVPAPPGEAVDP